jgi:hypothetical protein
VTACLSDFVVRCVVVGAFLGGMIAGAGVLIWIGRKQVGGWVLRSRRGQPK